MNKQNRQLATVVDLLAPASFKVDEADKVPNMAGYKRRRWYRVQ